MYSIDDIENMISRVLDEIPDKYFVELNGGVILRDESKPHTQSAGNLFILGEYHNQPRGCGRFICIYYGSFMRVYPYAPQEQLFAHLRDTLLHELTHHLESLAGERDLEIEDKIKLNEYRRIHRTGNTS